MLSDAKARQISPGGKAPAAGGITGLFLYPSARRGEGKRILRLVSPVTGKRRDIGLGACPGTGIALARQLGAEARTLIAEGKDPIEARRLAEIEEQTAVSDATFREAAQRVYEELRPGFRNAKYAASWITALESYVFRLRKALSGHRHHTGPASSAVCYSDGLSFRRGAQRALGGTHFRQRSLVCPGFPNEGKGNASRTAIAEGARNFPTYGERARWLALCFSFPKGHTPFRYDADQDPAGCRLRICIPCL